MEWPADGTTKGRRPEPFHRAMLQDSIAAAEIRCGNLTLALLEIDYSNRDRNPGRCEVARLRRALVGMQIGWTMSFLGTELVLRGTERLCVKQARLWSREPREIPQTVARTFKMVAAIPQQQSRAA